MKEMLFIQLVKSVLSGATEYTRNRQNINLFYLLPTIVIIFQIFVITCIYVMLSDLSRYSCISRIVKYTGLRLVGHVARLRKTGNESGNLLGNLLDSLHVERL